MAGQSKPLLLLDVDGVLAPVVDDASPWGFVRHVVTASTGQRHHVWLNPDHGFWLNSLQADFELVWATGWEHDAPRLLGPILGLQVMEVIVFTQRPQLDSRLRKLPDVAARVGEAPMAWIDDDLDAAVHDWANNRTPPTVLVEPDSTRGLTEEHVRQLKTFSELVSAPRD